MRRFHSYGPVNCEKHFCVERRELIAQCADQLIGDPSEGGHYFTIWAPRQTGKTWLMKEAIKDISSRYKDQYAVCSFSLGGLRGAVLEDQKNGFEIPLAFQKLLSDSVPGKNAPLTWHDFVSLFSKSETGAWDRPLILCIDEVDTAPPDFLDILVGQFRELYLNRGAYRLHGLALIGVRAVLGVVSEQGSPFNIQRSLHVPNFTCEEVTQLYDQYQNESGQCVDSKVVDRVFNVTHGQPGLVCWFGELLTEKYNPGQDKRVDLTCWEKVYHLACHVERNNTVMNLIKKARSDYLPHVMKLFSKPDMAFQVDAQWCDYLYLNGIIDNETYADESGRWKTVCRFSSSFVQHRIYNALTNDLIADQMPIPAVELSDDLKDVFEGKTLNLQLLLKRYIVYLSKLKAKGINPWKDQPRRSDLHLTEAVGHFHLYAWLQNAVGSRCVISPEFPTGNGKVDLHIRCGTKQGIIEIKSYTDRSQLKTYKRQAARYAKETGYSSVAVALFVPTEDEAVIREFTEEVVIEKTRVFLVAIGWH